MNCDDWSLWTKNGKLKFNFVRLTSKCNSNLQLPDASSVPLTTFLPFPIPMRPKRRSTRRRTRCNDRLIPSPVRRLLNEPRRNIEAAMCEPNMPVSRSGGDSFDPPRNHRTIPPKRLTEFRSELDPESGKNVRSLCLGVSIGWLPILRFIFDTGLWLSPPCSSCASASSRLCRRKFASVLMSTRGRLFNSFTAHVDDALRFLKNNFRWFFVSSACTTDASLYCMCLRTKREKKKTDFN